MPKFKARKPIHYLLIACILLAQIALGYLYYKDFKNQEDLKFLKLQLEEIETIQNLTDHSRESFEIAQQNFQTFLIKQDEPSLNQFLSSVDHLAKKLENLEAYKKAHPELKVSFNIHQENSPILENLRKITDSTQKIIPAKLDSFNQSFLPISRYKFDNFHFENYDVQTETYSDSTERKGLFGRLKDAFSGKESTRKDSTVITLTQNNTSNSKKLKKELDSIMQSVGKYYTKEIKKIHYRIIEKQQTNASINQNANNAFNQLLIMSNNLMTVYEVSVQNAKKDLLKKQAEIISKKDKLQHILIVSSLIIMFLATLFSIYFTRLAFLYEQKLKEANIKIHQSLDFKNRLLGMLSHELRSPLKIIGIITNKIHKKTTDNSIKDYLQSISYTSNSLLLQANQILEYTKNQHIENTLNPRVFNLKDELYSITKSIQAYIETRQNRFELDIDPRTDLEVFSDNAKLNQIFMNILGNANKFTEQGIIKLSTSVEQIDSKTIMLQTKINDTGIGIPQKDLDIIFEAYYQGALSNDVENIGAGLGLNLCKELVELYDGTISVDSHPNQGTCVSFTLYLNLK